MLVSVMQSLLHANELKIAKSLPDATALVSELQDFRANYQRERLCERFEIGSGARGTDVDCDGRAPGMAVRRCNQ